MEEWMDLEDLHNLQIRLKVKIPTPSWLKYLQ